MIVALVPAGGLAIGAEIALPEAEAHHLRVRRIPVGERLELRDGAGGVAVATLLESGRTARVRVETVGHHPPLAALRLVVGAGDRERFEWVAEKAGEFGVTELVPLVSERTESVATRVRANHLERIRRRASEAIKQSGAAWAPVVTDPLTPAEACDRYREGNRWLADAGGGVVPGGIVTPLTAVVGPEGGLTAGERELFVAGGFRPVRLAPHVLRFETAAIAVAVLVRGSPEGGLDD